MKSSKKEFIRPPEILEAVKRIAELQEQAKALGLFTNDRELLECPTCGLKEDVAFSGLLITYFGEPSGDDLGLSEDEKAFYDALTRDITVKDFMDDETLKKIAQELTESVRKSVTVDWQVKESARANMRRTIKRLLKKYKYPPEQTKGAVEIVIKQVELMCENENDGAVPFRYKPVPEYWSQVAEKE